MRINIRATGMDLTPAMSDYVQSKIGALGKFVVSEGESVMADVEVGKTTNHHRAGDIFRAEVNITLPNKLVREVVEAENLYSAVDLVKDKLAHQLGSKENKKLTLFRRGARKVKNLLRGFRS